jgi:hypothetical protein
VPNDDSNFARSPKSGQRLTPTDRDRELHPLRRAHQITRYSLYWIPVDSFPIPANQRAWLMCLIDNLRDLLTKRHNLRPELFLQFKCIYPTLHEAFVKAAPEFIPIAGISLRPGTSLPPTLTQEDFNKIVSGDKTFSFDKDVADYAYWFVEKAERKQRELFFGHGGMTMLFLQSDPNTMPPNLPISKALKSQPLFQRFDIERLVARTFSLRDGFLHKSKQLFGADIEGNPAYSGLAFVLPLLNSSHFLTCSDRDIEKWFDLFGAYLCESPPDRGVLFASLKDVDEELIGLLKKMREEDGLEYPTS